MKTRVLVVDDHPILREGVATLVNQQPDLVMCGEAEDTPQALQAIQRLRPDVVLMDITLKNGNGIELINEIRDVFPSLPVLVLSFHDESLFAARAVKAGAQGYIMKQESGANLIAALRQIIRGEVYLNKNLISKVSEHFSSGGDDPNRLLIDSLSDRELEVFQLLGHGKSTRQIASDLGLSGKTIEAYRRTLKKKLHIKERTGLMRFAVQWLESEKNLVTEEMPT